MTPRPKCPQIFNPEHFDKRNIPAFFPKINERPEPLDTEAEFAAVAQSIFQAWIEKQAIVVGRLNDESFSFTDINGSIAKNHYYGCSTHVAYLVEPTLIQETECEHEPSGENVWDPQIENHISSCEISKCKHCGVKLKATWTAEET